MSSSVSPAESRPWSSRKWSTTPCSAATVRPARSSIEVTDWSQMTASFPVELSLVTTTTCSSPAAPRTSCRSGSGCWRRAVLPPWRRASPGSRRRIAARRRARDPRRSPPLRRRRGKPAGPGRVPQRERLAGTLYGSVIGRGLVLVRCPSASPSWSLQPRRRAPAWPRSPVESSASPCGDGNRVTARGVGFGKKGRSVGRTSVLQRSHLACQRSCSAPKGVPPPLIRRSQRDRGGPHAWRLLVAALWPSFPAAT